MRARRTDLRGPIPRYYDANGNELDGPNGDIVDWRAMRLEIEELRATIEELRAKLEGKTNGDETGDANVAGEGEVEPVPPEAS